MGEIHVQDSGKGYLLVTYLGQVPEPEFRAYLDTLSNHLRGGKAFGTVVDARQSEMNSPVYLRMQSSWQNEHRAKLKELNYGTALVLDQPVLRFALSTLLSIAPMPGQYSTAATLGEAIAWVERHIAKQTRRRSGAPL